MRGAALLPAGREDDVIAWSQGEGMTRARFLHDVHTLAQRLPERPYVLNHCEDRYHFLVGLAAALLRRQMSLFPPSRAPQVLEQLARAYPGAYCLSDQPDELPIMELVTLTRGGGAVFAGEELPPIPLEQTVVIAFTSGSTGNPKPYPKTWNAVTHETRVAARSLGLAAGEPGYVVSTVPPQHMYGFIYSVIMPAQLGYVIGAQRPFYPEDIRKALTAYSRPGILITTPVHIRACVREQAPLPPLRLIISATAPLADTLAQQAETLFHTRVLEVYGSTETASIAARHTVATDVWRTFDDIEVSQSDHSLCVSAPYLPRPMVLSDTVEVRGKREFILFGRDVDMVKIAGKRMSLAELNRHLLEVEGVTDAVFFLPDAGAEGRELRLSAFVVAPGRTREQILEALRARIDPVFLPRPLRLLESLPRNATGKLPRADLMRLWEEHEQAEGMR